MTYAVFFVLVRRLLGVPVPPSAPHAGDADVRAVVAERTLSDDALFEATLGVLGDVVRQAKAQFLGPLVVVDEALPADAALSAAATSVHRLPGDCVRVLVTRVQAVPVAGTPGGTDARPALFVLGGDLAAMADRAQAPALGGEYVSGGMYAVAVRDDGAVEVFPPAAAVIVAYVAAPDGAATASPTRLAAALPVGAPLVPALALAVAARLATRPLAAGGEGTVVDEAGARFFADAYAAAIRPLLLRRTSGVAYEHHTLGRHIDREVVTE